MYQGERCIAIIPARGGSKSIFQKNVLSLAGKPLVVWSIEKAIQSAHIDRIIVSTDDDEIAEASDQAGAEVWTRPADLATDSALVIDAIRNLVSRLRDEGEKADCFVLLEPTSPLRSIEDIDSCIAKLIDESFDSVATFCQCEHHPHRAWTLANNTAVPFIPGANPWLPRQELPYAYRLNGGVYCFRSSVLEREHPGLLAEKTGCVVVPPERSVDIDTRIDFKIAEMLLESESTPR